MHGLEFQGVNGLQGLDLGKGRTKPLGGKATADELAQVYDTMLGHGFRKEHVQQALQVRLRLNIPHDLLFFPSNWPC